MSFPDDSDGKVSAYNSGDPGFNLRVGKISWRSKWQTTPIFLPGKSHGQKNLVGYSPCSHKELDMNERLHFHFDFKLLDISTLRGFSGGSVVKNLPANAGDVGSTPLLERSPGGGNNNSLQYSCLGNPMDRSNPVGCSSWGHKSWKCLSD